MDYSTDSISSDESLSSNEALTDEEKVDVIENKPNGQDLYKEYELKLHGNKDYYQLIGVKASDNLETIKQRCWKIQKGISMSHGMNITQAENHDIDREEFCTASQQLSDWQQLMRTLTNQTRREEYDAIRNNYTISIKDDWTVMIIYYINNLILTQN